MKYSHAVIAALLVSCLSAPVTAAPGKSWGNTDKMSAVEEKIDAKQYQAAIDELKLMVNKDEKNADAFNLLGFSNRKLKRYDIAEYYYMQALELDPKHKGAMEYLGELYVETGRMEKAQQMLARLDDACFFSCDEYKQLKGVIEGNAQGVKTSSKW